MEEMNGSGFTITQPEECTCFKLELPRIEQAEQLNEPVRRSLTLDSRTGAAAILARSGIFVQGGSTIPMELEQVTIPDILFQLNSFFKNNKLSFTSIVDWLSPEVFFLDLIARRWHRLQLTDVDRCLKRLFHSLSYYNSCLYIFGGLVAVQNQNNITLTPTNDLWELNLQSRKWTLLSPSNNSSDINRRFNHAMHVVYANDETKDTKLLIVGGLNVHNQYVTDMDVYNLTTRSWELHYSKDESLEINCNGTETPIGNNANPTITIPIRQQDRNSFATSQLIIYAPENSFHQPNYNSNMSPLICLPLEPNTKGFQLPLNSKLDENFQDTSFTNLMATTASYYHNNMIIGGFDPNSRTKNQYKVFSYDFINHRWCRIGLHDIQDNNTPQFWKIFTWSSHRKGILLGNGRKKDTNNTPTTVQNFTTLTSFNLHPLDRTNDTEAASKVTDNNDIYSIPATNTRTNSMVSHYENYIKYLAPEDAPQSMSKSVFPPYAMVLGKDAMEIFGSCLADFEIVSNEGYSMAVPMYLLRKRWGRYFDRLIARGYTNASANCLPSSSSSASSTNTIPIAKTDKNRILSEPRNAHSTSSLTDPPRKTEQETGTDTNQLLASNYTDTDDPIFPLGRPSQDTSSTVPLKRQNTSSTTNSLGGMVFRIPFQEVDSHNVDMKNDQYVSNENEDRMNDIFSDDNIPNIEKDGIKIPLQKPTPTEPLPPIPHTTPFFLKSRNNSQIDPSSRKSYSMTSTYSKRPSLQDGSRTQSRILRSSLESHLLDKPATYRSLDSALDQDKKPAPPTVRANSLPKFTVKEELRKYSLCSEASESALTNVSPELEPLLTPRSLFIPWPTSVIKAFVEFFYTGHISSKWPLTPVVLDLLVVSKLYEVPLLYSLILEVLYTIIMKKEDYLLSKCEQLLTSLESTVDEYYKSETNGTKRTRYLELSETWPVLQNLNRCLLNINAGYLDADIIRRSSIALSASTQGTDDKEQLNDRISAETTASSLEATTSSNRADSNRLFTNPIRKRSSLSKDTTSLATDGNKAFSTNKNNISVDNTTAGLSDINDIQNLLQKLQLKGKNRSDSNKNVFDAYLLWDDSTSSDSDFEGTEFLSTKWDKRAEKNKKATESIDPLSKIGIIEENKSLKNEAADTSSKWFFKESFIKNAKRPLLLEDLSTANAQPPTDLTIRSFHRVAVLVNDGELIARSVDCLGISKRLKSIEIKVTNEIKTVQARIDAGERPITPPVKSVHPNPKRTTSIASTWKSSSRKFSNLFPRKSSSSTNTITLPERTKNSISVASLSPRSSVVSSNRSLSVSLEELENIPSFEKKISKTRRSSSHRNVPKLGPTNVVDNSAKHLRSFSLTNSSSDSGKLRKASGTDNSNSESANNSTWTFFKSNN